MLDIDDSDGREARRFRRQLRSTLTITAMLFAINALTSWGYWWFYWPALGMGIGVAVQYKRLLDARDKGHRHDRRPADRIEGEAATPLGAEDALVHRAEALAAREKAAG